MLYDKKWDLKTPLSPTLVGFKKWLSKQEPNRRYIYSDSSKCAVAQYMNSIGYNHYDLNLHKKDNTKLFGVDVANAIAHSRTFGQLKEKLTA